MGIKYVLKISTKSLNAKIVNSAIKQNPTSINPYWELEINEQSAYFTNAINYLIDTIEQSKEDLKQDGIKNEDFSIWVYFVYKEQCNLEFNPSELIRLGKNRISLCVSCWHE